MKANGSMLGGSMRRQYMPSYANYFVKFLRSYEAEGVPVQAVTVHREVDTDQDGRTPACIWPQEYEADFVRYNLGPLFEREAIKTEI
jgi:glucosylceramidase